MADTPFRLVIEERGAGQYLVQHGTTSSMTTFAITAELLKDIRDLSARPPDGFGDVKTQEACARRVGKVLAAMLFGGGLRRDFDDYLDEVDKPRIVLRLPPTLYWLPWEVLYLDGQKHFFSLQGSVIREHTETSSGAPRSNRLFTPIPPSGVLHCVLAKASPEERPLPGFTLASIPRVQIDDVKPPTFDAFKTALRPGPRTVVFYGHGDIAEGAPPAEGTILVFVREERTDNVVSYVSDNIPAHVAANALFQPPKGKTVQLACLLACESAWASRAGSFDRSIVGSILERTYIDLVIGAQTEIHYLAARAFLGGMLKALSEGTPIDLAVSEGRKATTELHDRDRSKRFAPLDWWVPVLYTRADCPWEVFSAPSDLFVEVPTGTPGVVDLPAWHVSDIGATPIALARALTSALTRRVPTVRDILDLR